MQEKIVIIYFYASLNSDAESNLNFLINISVIVFVLNISICFRCQFDRFCTRDYMHCRIGIVGLYERK